MADFLTETFTGAQAALAGQTPDTGSGAWQTITGLAGLQKTGAGRATNNDAVLLNAGAVNLTDPGADDYTAVMVMDQISSNNSIISLIVRGSTVANTGYHLQYSSAGPGYLAINRVAAGVVTELGFFDAPDPIADPSTLRLEVSGTGATVTLLGYLNDVLKISTTDTNVARIVARGRVGLYVEDRDNNVAKYWQPTSIRGYIPAPTIPAGGITINTGGTTGTISTTSSDIVYSEPTGSMVLTIADVDYTVNLTGSPAGTATFSINSGGKAYIDQPITATSNFANPSLRDNGTGSQVTDVTDFTVTNNSTEISADATSPSGPVGVVSSDGTYIDVTIADASGPLLPETLTATYVSGDTYFYFTADGEVHNCSSVTRISDFVYRCVLQYKIAQNETVEGFYTGGRVKIRIPSNPADGVTLTVRGVTFEYDSGGGVSGGNTAITIGASLADTIDATLAALKANSDVYAAVRAIRSGIITADGIALYPGYGALATTATGSITITLPTPLTDNVMNPLVQSEGKTGFTVTNGSTVTGAAIITEMATTGGVARMTPCPIFFHAANSIVGRGGHNEARFVWTATTATSLTCTGPVDGASHNIRTQYGPTAGWLFATGSHTVALDIYNRDGTHYSTTTSVTVVARTGIDIYVDFAAGNDANSGLDSAHPVKTLAQVKVLADATTGTRVFFNGGMNHDRATEVSLSGVKNLLMDAYGAGTPVLRYTGAYSGSNQPLLSFVAATSCQNIVIQNINFDSNQNDSEALSNPNLVHAITPNDVRAIAIVNVSSVQTVGSVSALPASRIANLVHAAAGTGNPTGLLKANCTVKTATRYPYTGTVSTDGSFTYEINFGVTGLGSAQESVYRFCGVGVSHLFCEYNNEFFADLNSGSLGGSPRVTFGSTKSSLRAAGGQWMTVYGCKTTSSMNLGGGQGGLCGEQLVVDACILNAGDTLNNDGVTPSASEAVNFDTGVQNTTIRNSLFQGYDATVFLTGGNIGGTVLGDRPTRGFSFINNAFVQSTGNAENWKVNFMSFASIGNDLRDNQAPMGIRWSNNFFSFAGGVQATGPFRVYDASQISEFKSNRAPASMKWRANTTDYTTTTFATLVSGSGNSEVNIIPSAVDDLSDWPTILAIPTLYNALRAKGSTPVDILGSSVNRGVGPIGLQLASGVGGVKGIIGSGVF